MGKIENMKIICIRQPGYLPNIGFFQKMEASDVFVYLDDTRYGSEKWDNRNKIRSDTGSMFLTVPIVKKTIKSLNQILISENEDWQKKHLGGIFLNYKKTPYFENYWPTLKQILEKKWNKLYELNLELIDWIKNELKIETETILSSELTRYITIILVAIMAPFMSLDISTKLAHSSPQGMDSLISNVMLELAIVTS